MDVQAFLSRVYLGNTGQDWLVALAIFIVVFAAFQLFRGYVLHVLARIATKTRTQLDDLVIEALQGVSWRANIVISLFFATRALAFGTLAARILDGALLILVVYYAVKFLHRLIGLAASHEAEKRREPDVPKSQSFVVVLGRIGQGVLWVIAFLLILANFGVEITPLIASLGVGGIAVAFALQNILEDLFSSFSIYFDKPFEEGDFIIIQQDMGVVEHIGMKTTRIKTLQGQELVVSNRELTSTRINNYKRMDERRVAFSLGVEYGTSLAKLKKVNEFVRKAVEGTDKCRLDRTHFKQFGDFALLFEVVYYINTNDYNVYMDCQQEINFRIKESFEKAKISMAFPTQTVHLKK